ncbi:MAG: hypothetical protein A2987_01800 [Omnitrophica bacterium RIFCSPLOWO2_01_FULL_45_10]|nr:MAG: hypothetical protein A2987_01800 [Omnitrophica bacterium RIFCSPLOWO2_01_FULL_45_10]
MNIKLKRPPRAYRIGIGQDICILDCGEVRLDNNEQVTFVTKAGKRYDVTAKSWGFYATPSVNSRLKKEGFRTALVKNRDGRLFVMLVDETKISLFKKYLKSETSKVEKWLDGLK